ncbi:uncharacterized protein LOC124264014 [Haliotis rubra]|uniref:uncharacterized protein LOC124264014 n=1 Tax=Haliotis rubra TaxID=36100 RepID=UPI001EE52005|nr:uncharacterized protein LOC124264014 [Haliotis rubra]
MKQAWKSVADRMSEKGFHFTGPECDRKFRSMKSRHRTIVGRNKTTGSGRSTWRYFSLMDHLTQGDPAVEPLAPVGSLPTTHTQERSSVDGETVAEEPPATAAPRRRRSSSGDRMESAITALRRDLLTMHQERMELETRRVVALESIAQFLKEKHK